jgi:hypothetical protein
MIDLDPTTKVDALGRAVVELSSVGDYLRVYFDDGTCEDMTWEEFDLWRTTLKPKTGANA